MITEAVKSMAAPRRKPADAEERAQKKFIGQRVEEARKALGWDQDDLARRLSVSSQSISAIERGRSTPNAPRLGKIAQVLQQPVSFFYPHPREGKVAVKFYDLIDRLPEEKQQKWYDFMKEMYPDITNDPLPC